MIKKISKKIAIISLGYLWFPCESGTSRFFDIAMQFVKSGWEVECITTSFQHFKKEPRDQKKILAQNYPFQITFIEAPAYDKNVSLKRVCSNSKAARNLKAYLEGNIEQYDLIYVSIPANNIAAIVTEAARQHDIPCVVDVEDLWPEAMAMVIKNGMIRKVLLHSFTRDAETAYRNASGIIGTSEDYTDRAFKHRARTIPAETVYVGCHLEEFDNGVKQFQNQIIKGANEYWVTYAGSISTSYDIKTLIDAVSELKSENIQLQILGTGSLKDELEEYSRNMKNIHFWGFTEYHHMAAALSKSDIVVNSFVKGAPQSIVNKVGDYLASGKPMINTLENPIFCRLVQEKQIGLNIEPGDSEKLKKAILTLYNNSTLSRQYGLNARRLCEEQFDRSKSYKRIVSMAEELIDH